MQFGSQPLSIAIRLALSVGLVAPAMVVQAQDATATQNQSSEQAQASDAKNLNAVQVTGSLIRRVDTETANPVVTIDRGALTDNGSPTLGNVLQALPSIAGNATNAQNNSSGGGAAGPTLEGGSGAARVSLRGLGINRTLLLIDGQRLANPDLNMIPQNMIERVDVLAEGASTVYGSDAIGGVLNAILRKDYQGAELSVNDGVSSHGDGQRHGGQFTVGASGEKGSIVGGIDYNQYDPVSATRRSFSAHPLQLSHGAVSVTGSGSIPSGRMLIPGTSPAAAGCKLNSQGNTYVTLASGAGDSLGDYRCYSSASDSYNYNAYNYIQTQQERSNLFVLGNYKITDNLSYFADVFYNHTHASGRDAPVNVNTDYSTYVLANNPINPFGLTFSNGTIGDPTTSGYYFGTRLTGLGPRLDTFTTDNKQLNTGLRGAFGQSSWTWDASVDYGHEQRAQTIYNVVNVAALQDAINNGLNIFDQANPAVTTLIRRLGADNPTYSLTNTLKQAQFNASGELWDLPAGAVQLSAGALYRKNSMNYVVPPEAALDLATNSCLVPGATCSTSGHGSVDVREIYAETLIPLLSEQPGAYSLNVDVGVRASDYSVTRSTTNGKFAVEYRPIADLLVRGTVSQVFRAPNPDELYDGVTVDNPTLADPCIGLSAAQLAQHQAACRYVPAGWDGGPQTQTPAYLSGATTAGGQLKPEHGKSIDIGFVYSPTWLTGVSTSLDVWHIYLQDLLTPISGQTVLNACFANENSPYCAYINRQNTGSQSAGAINYLDTPVVNLGNLSTAGVDFTLNYAIAHFNLGSVNPGNFKLGLNTSYISTYKNNAAPGQPGSSTINYAGTYSEQFGNIARWRGTFTLNWKRGHWNAQWQTRYISSLTTRDADYATGASAPLASVMYHSIQAGYEVPGIHTRFDVGIDNLADKLPPLIYQLSTNYNVDTSTYDTLGRYYWARATVKF